MVIMQKLFVFDLDGTLAAIDKGIQTEVITLLKKLEDKGHRIVICSGKPTYYLCGFFRQAGLKEPILIGENGANIQFGVELPPEKFYIYPYSEEIKRWIQHLKELIVQNMGEDIWIQPNLVGLTVFPKAKETFERIEDFLKEQNASSKDVNIYRHIDSFDIMPKEINKYNGLKYLSEIMNIASENMVAVGDGQNDIPMFEYAGFSLGIGEGVTEYVDHSFKNVLEALIFLDNVF